MTKPHEEKLTVRKSGHEYRVVREAGADDPLRRYSLAMIYVPGPNDDLEINSYEEGEALAKARARQFAAAPDMVRALKFMLDAFPRAAASIEEAQAREAARHALWLAGVPLP